MKRLLIAISIFSSLFTGCWCNACNPKTAVSSQNDARSITFADDTLYMGPYHIDAYFGFDGGSEWRKCEVPDIDGLIYRSTKPIHIGLRCPSYKPLLSWTAGRLDKFTEWSIGHPEDTTKIPFESCKNPESAEDLMNHYMGILGPKPVDHLDPEWEDSAIQQFAILLTDICLLGDYCTMQEVTWYDFASCGDNTTRSWFTIDVKTGKEFGLEDIVRDNRRTDLEKIILKYLRNHTSFWYDMNKDSLPNPGYLIENMTGCALLEDGIICYYHPYILGCGADGQFNAAIPYSELSGILKIKL